MLDQVDAGLDGPHHRLLRAAVGRGQPVELPRLPDQGLKLPGRVGGEPRDGAGRAAAGGHDLDVVGSLVHQPPHRAADLLLAVGDLVAHVEVAPGAGDRAAADQHLRSRDVPPPQSFLEGEADPVAGPVLAQGGDAGVQVAAQVHGADERHGLVALAEGLAVGAAVAGQAEMGVAVDQPGGQTAAGQVDRRGFGRHLLRDRLRRSDRGDAAVAHEHRLASPGAAAEAVGEQPGPDEQRLRIRLGHSFSPFDLSVQ